MRTPKHDRLGLLLRTIHEREALDRRDLLLTRLAWLLLGLASIALFAILASLYSL